MPIRALLEKRPYGALMPVAEADVEQLAQLPVGARVRVDITLAKSPDMLRWYWALIGYVAKGIGMDKDALSTEILIRTGRVDAFVLRSGAVHGIPRSIADMDRGAFHSYVDAAVQLLLDEYAPTMRRSQLLAEVLRMTGTAYEEFTESEASPSPPAPASDSLAGSPDQSGETEAGAEQSQAAEPGPASTRNIWAEYSQFFFDDAIKTVRDVRQADTKFFNTHPGAWPDDEGLRAKFRRIRTVHEQRVTGKIGAAEWSAALREEIAS